MKAKIRPQQSIFDAALQHCGSVEAAISMAAMNSCSLTDDIVSGTEMGLPPVSDSSVIDYYEAHNQVPATALAEGTITNEGIEYWAIEIDFIVS